MEKVLLVGVARGGQLAEPDLDTACAAVAALDPQRHPHLRLQTIDLDASTAWWGDRQPVAPAMAVVSVWSEDPDLAELIAVTETWSNLDWSVAPVTESVLRWDTEPGVVLTSLLHRRPDLTRDEFVAHWSDVHVPLSLRIHPQTTYVQNVVDGPTDDGGFDAVCEEGCPTARDVLDPTRFFGADGGDWTENRRTIVSDVPKFLDRAATSASIMRDHLLRGSRPTNKKGP